MNEVSRNAKLETNEELLRSVKDLSRSDAVIVRTGVRTGILSMNTASFLFLIKQVK